MVRIGYSVVNAVSSCYPQVVPWEEDVIKDIHGELVKLDELAALFTRNRSFDLFEPTTDDVGKEQLFLRPPICTTTRVVWGFRYETLCTSEGVHDRERTVPVVRVREGDRDPLELLLLALTAENRGGRYLWREIDRIVALWEDHRGERCTGELPPHLREAIDPERDVRASLRTFRRLAPALQDAVDTDTIDLRTAKTVPQALIPRIASVLEHLAPFTFSERRQLLRMIGDIVKANGGDTSVVDEIFALDGAELFSAVRRTRRPKSAEIEDRLEEFQRRYTKGSGVSVLLPPNLEGDHIEVSFRVRSRRELERRVSALTAMEEGVDDLLGLLF